MRMIATIMAALLTLAGCACLREAAAADLSRRSRIATPQPPVQPYSLPATEEPVYKTHNWYIGGMGGYFWAPEGADDTWHGGIVAGYLWRNAVLGLGIEADYMLRDLGNISIDDGVASLRGRAGVFVAPRTFLYGTAGIAHATEAAAPAGKRQGLVVGGGIEKDVLANVAVRAEVLHYRHTDEYFGWGDDGSTAVRLGLGFKF